MKSEDTTLVGELLEQVEEKAIIKIPTLEGRLKSPIQARTGDWSWNEHGNRTKHDGPMMNGHPFYNPRPGPTLGII